MIPRIRTERLILRASMARALKAVTGFLAPGHRLGCGFGRGLDGPHGPQRTWRHPPEARA